jgi:hypothetical protein
LQRDAENELYQIKNDTFKSHSARFVNAKPSLTYTHQRPQTFKQKCSTISQLLSSSSLRTLVSSRLQLTAKQLARRVSCLLADPADLLFRYELDSTSKVK